MIRFHSIQRQIQKSDPSTQVVLHMYYEDVADLCHILWECRKKDMLKTENEKLLQLEFQNLRHLMIDGQTCEPFEICSIHERLEEMGCGDEKQGFEKWHDIEADPNDLPEKDALVLVKVQNQKTKELLENPFLARLMEPETGSKKPLEWIRDDRKKLELKVVKWKNID